jgi:hypothetical protein
MLNTEIILVIKVDLRQLEQLRTKIELSIL